MHKQIWIRARNCTAGISWLFVFVCFFSLIFKKNIVCNQINRPWNRLSARWSELIIHQPGEVHLIDFPVSPFIKKDHQGWIPGHTSNMSHLRNKRSVPVPLLPVSLPAPSSSFGRGKTRVSGRSACSVVSYVSLWISDFGTKPSKIKLGSWMIQAGEQSRRAKENYEKQFLNVNVIIQNLANQISLKITAGFIVILPGASSTRCWATTLTHWILTRFRWNMIYLWKWKYGFVKK